MNRYRSGKGNAKTCNSCLNIWEGHVSLIHSFRASKTSQNIRLTVERFKLLGASRSHLELSQRLGSQLSPSTPLQSCENQCQSADQLLVCMCVCLCVSNNCMNRKVNPGTGCERICSMLKGLVQLLLIISRDIIIDVKMFASSLNRMPTKSNSVLEICFSPFATLRS